MDEEILINCAPRETRVAVLSGGVLQDLHIECKASRGFVGNIYLGRVVRVLPGMQSAFVDIGLERTGFLHVLDIDGARISAHEVTPIEKILTDGQSLMVQVSKDPIGTKGARLTTGLSLAGRKLVYLPGDSHIGVSQKIEDEELRESLRTMVASLRDPEKPGGYIVRTSVEEGVCDDDFREDMAYLGRLWSEVSDKALNSAAPALLYEDLGLEKQVLRDMVKAGTGEILVDSRATLEELRAFASHFVPSAVAKLRFYDGERPLFDAYGIDDEIEKLLARRVTLKSGGYLVIDQTEAMTTIDVNTGAFIGKKDFAQTVFKTNLEAAHEIARQLRLRNLGGIIIIDFIDMSCDEHREAVLAKLRAAVAGDHTKLTVSEFTELGLVEMTRKRTTESLSHVLCETCPVCGGRGRIKSARSVCYQVMREIVRESRQYQDARGFKVLGSESVVEMFLEEEAATLNLLQEAIGRPVNFEVEPSYTQEEYEVIIL